MGIRKLLALTAALLMVGCASSPTKLPTAAEQPVKIVFATDLHFLSQELTLNDDYFMARVYNGDGKALHLIDGIVDAFVAQLLEQRPDAVVLGGDLSLDGELASHRELSAKLKKLSDAGIPVLALTGNHDTNNYLAGSFVTGERVRVESATYKQFERLYGGLAIGRPLSSDKDSASCVYALRSDLRVLLLDVNDCETFNMVSDDTLAWLEKQLADAEQQGATVIAASHQNLLRHNPLFDAGYIVSNADRVLELYRRYNVPLNLSGHIHLQHASTEDGFCEVVTSSLAVNPSQYAMVAYDGKAITYDTLPVDVAAWAAINAPGNAELNDFANVTRKLFWDIAYQQSYYALHDVGYTEERVVAMSEFYADVNTLYFAGMPQTRTTGDDAYDMWRRDGDFRYQYISSMLADPQTDHNHLRIEV